MMDTNGSDAVRRLMRRSAEGRLGGVCAGIAEYLDVDIALVRFAWVVLSIFPGCIFGGLLAYGLAWLIMPDAPASMAPPSTVGKRLTRSVVDRRIAGVCGGLAHYFGVDPTVTRVLWVILSVVPGTVVVGLLAYVLAWIIIPEQPTAPATTVPSPA
jgi:phage shock protein PspC (stress-responsive transcriptional regulator)